MDTTTLGGSPNSSALVTLVPIRASPESDTSPPGPFTEPVSGTTRTGLPAAVSPRASRSAQRVAPTATSAMRTTREDDFVTDIVRSPRVVLGLERGRLDVVRSAERHALRRRDRSRQRVEERLARAIDLPPDEHRVVLVHRVVAVLHEHSAEVAELHGEGHAARRTEPVDVLAALLPRRHVRGAAVPGEDLAFLEVDVDRVIPSAAAVLDRPDLASPVLGSSRDAAEVGVQHPVVVGLDAPRSEEGADRVVRVLASTQAELEHALTHHRDLREIGVRD